MGNMECRATRDSILGVGFERTALFRCAGERLGRREPTQYGVASSRMRARRLDARERIPTIAGDAGVRPRSGRNFFFANSKKPQPFRVEARCLAGSDWFRVG
jgi:hypothetical protein